ncbi:MAG: rhamnose/proton symporter RhaT [Muribaculaceae bacterium]|nr:rhamnose/proton symporter RhaT [Muribaculaceae bacterium]
MISLGLLIIAAGAFCQSSSYVPIKKIRSWHWESFWLVQGIFAWLVFPLLGAQLAVPADESLMNLIALHRAEAVKTIICGVLWGVGGLTFGLSMRYLGVALGQSIALGTCAALGTVLGPLFMGDASSLTWRVLAGVGATLAGIAVIGVAGSMRQASSGEAEKQTEFKFGKGLLVALICGLMSACFNIGLDMGRDICFDGSDPMFRSLPATMLVTLGGFATNAVYCLWQNRRNRSFSDYGQLSVWPANLILCALAGILWYSQFFGLSLGKGFLQNSPVLLTFSWCILMALNVIFSNLWGVVLKEWQGTTRGTKAMLAVGLIILIVSSFLPQIL